MAVCLWQQHKGKDVDCGVMSKLASSLSFPALAINWPLALCNRCLVRCGRALLMVHRSPLSEEWAKTKDPLL